MVTQAHTHYPHDGGCIAHCLCNAPMAPEPVYGAITEPHTHTTPDGVLVKCYHQCRSVFTSPAFWIGSTLSFPIEHALWTKIPFLHAIALWAGL